MHPRCNTPGTQTIDGYSTREEYLSNLLPKLPPLLQSAPCRGAQE